MYTHGGRGRGRTSCPNPRRPAAELHGVDRATDERSLDHLHLIVQIDQNRVHVLFIQIETIAALPQYSHEGAVGLNHSDVGPVFPLVPPRLEFEVKFLRAPHFVSDLIRLPNQLKSNRKSKLISHVYSP